MSILKICSDLDFQHEEGVPEIHVDQNTVDRVPVVAECILLVKLKAVKYILEEAGEFVMVCTNHPVENDPVVGHTKDAMVKQEDPVDPEILADPLAEGLIAEGIK